MINKKDNAASFRVPATNPVTRMLLSRGYTERRLNKLCNRLRLPGKYTGGAASGAMPSNVTVTVTANGKAS